MQYVRSISGSVSKTWNSINPATLSGAIDVIVVEQEDGSLACSPFHVRFGKFSLLRPYEKKVEFRVNDVKQEYSMKLGEGGEAFFVFETSDSVPEALQTSPLVSPASSPQARPAENPPATGLQEPEPLDLMTSQLEAASLDDQGMASLDRENHKTNLRPSNLQAPERFDTRRPMSGDWSGRATHLSFTRSASDEAMLSAHSNLSKSFDGTEYVQPQLTHGSTLTVKSPSERSTSPTPVSTVDARTRAMNLSKKLWFSNIPSHVTEQGDLMLDMTGYKSSEEDALRAEVMARKILSEELEGNYDIGALIGADEKGNVWIYSSEEAKEAAGRQAALNSLHADAYRSSDAISDPGYHSDDGQSDTESIGPTQPARSDTDSAVVMTSPPKSPDAITAGDPNRNYAKTLRLTSEQLKTMNLKPGANSMSFSVNRATCQAHMYYWRHDVPVVISDIDGTITKSDALGHVLNMIGRDWTHLGVAKLYTDIVANGYNIFYLTSRSVGQADTTRAYLNGVIQDGYKLPKGPVIMSPDRTIAALRREVYLRKPEVFKMACLRDIMSLFNKPSGQTPFCAGFGNRFTDALSYRSVNIPSTRIFTINSNAEVSLDLLTLNKYKTGYVSMREIVDHYFPPVTLLVKSGGEDYTDFNYWRERPLELEDFSASESEDSGDEGEDDENGPEGSIRSEDEGTEGLDEDDIAEDMEASYFSRDSIDETGDMGESILESIESDGLERSMSSVTQSDATLTEDEELEEGGEEEKEDLCGEEDREPTPTEDDERMTVGPTLSTREDVRGFNSNAPEHYDNTQTNLKELAQLLNSPDRTKNVRS